MSLQHYFQPSFILPQISDHISPFNLAILWLSSQGLGSLVISGMSPKLFYLSIEGCFVSQIMKLISVIMFKCERALYCNEYVTSLVAFKYSLFQ